MQIGDRIAWQWANGLAQGVIKEVHTDRTVIESKGKSIVRNGSPENPALIIEHSSGTRVLKLASEVKKTQGGSQ